MTTACRPTFALAGNRCMVRVLGAWLLFVVNEYAVWTAVLVYAFERGGTGEAAAAAIVQLVPAAVVAPVLATVADRRSPVVLLRLGLAGQVAGLALAAAVALVDGPSTLVFAGAVVAASAVAGVRPAMSLVVPGVARSAGELGAANAVVGWLENVGVIVAGLVAGVLLGVGGPAWVLGAGGLLVAGALLGTAGLRVARIGPDADPASGAALGVALRWLRRAPRPRALVLLVTAGWIVVGALDVLFVVVAVEVLHRGTSSAGYLTSGFGLGGVAAVVVTVLVVGRRLGRPVVVSSLVLFAALVLLAARPGPFVTLALVVVLGAARSVLEVTATTLLQRVVPGTMTGRVFGVVEGLAMAGMAVGALVVPAATAVGGPAAAPLVLAAVVAGGLLAAGRTLRRLDDGTAEPLVEISLLRQVARYADLPVAVLTALATTATRVDVARGDAVADGAVFAIASGEAEIRTPAGGSRTCGRGETLGGTATPGATVFARTPLTLYRLDETVVRVGLRPADRTTTGA